MSKKEKRVQPTSEIGNDAKPIVSGSLLLLELMQVAAIKNEDGMPVVHYVDKPIVTSSVCRHDGKINSGHHADQPCFCDQCGEEL